MIWTDIWSYNQQDYRSWPSKIWQDQQYITIRNNHFASAVRVRFSNKYGMEPISFKKVIIKNEASGQSLPVTIFSKEQVTILPGTELISDPLPLKLSPGVNLSLTTEIGAPVALTGGIVTYSKSITSVKNGLDRDFSQQKELFRMVAENNKMQYIYGIAGLDIPKQEASKKIVMFGDSLIQQGYIVDQLKQRLIEQQTLDTAIINRGIGGSRILLATDRNFDLFQRHGISGLGRFENDVFGQGEVDTVIVLHGINDIITAENQTPNDTFSFDNIIIGLKQYAEIAHSHGARCYIGTLMPLGKSIFFHPELEKKRQMVNDWIRNQQIFDGYFEFDEAVKDLQDFSQLKGDYDSGDGLHLNEAGGKKVAETISLQRVLSMDNTIDSTKMRGNN